MLKRRKNPYFIIVIGILISIIILKFFRIEGNGGKNKYEVIASDGRGYYAYLPSTFINNNLSCQSKELNFTNEVNGKIVNKYFVGTAVLMSPFFFVGHSLAMCFNYKVDGYSVPYQFMIAVSSIFFLSIGLIFLLKILRLFAISDKTSSKVLFFTLFSTNLLYYSVFDCSMSHVYSFSMITAFAYLIKKSLLVFHVKQIYFASILFAIIILIRPTNAIVILFPFVFANNNSELKYLVSKVLFNYKHVILSLFIFISIISIQFFVWYAQTKSFSIWSYSNEGFNFFNPQFFNSLFSFKKGLFIYTPFTFIALFGLIILYRRNKSLFYKIIFFLLILIFITSSWWNWYYGDSFGLRAYIDFYVIFALLLAILLEYINFWKMFIVLVLLVFCLILNLIQSYQFYNKILDPCDMNFEKYKFLLFKTSDTYKNIYGGKSDVLPFNYKYKKLIYSTKNDFERNYANWNNGDTSSKKNCIDLDNNSTSSLFLKKEFGCSFSIQNTANLYNSNKIFVKSSLKFLILDKGIICNSLFVIHVLNSKNQTQFYQTFNVNDIKMVDICTWKTYNYSFVLPKLTNKSDKISIYVWNKDHQNFLIDDFKIEFYGIN